MLVLKLTTDQVIRITVGDRVVRLIRSASAQNRVCIECDDDCAVERFKITGSVEFDSLEDLEKRTGVKIGGRGTAPATTTIPEKESRHEDRNL